LPHLGWIKRKHIKIAVEEKIGVKDTAKSEKVKAIGYVRVSNQEQTREEICVEAQEDRIRKYVELHNLSLVEVVKDEGTLGNDLNREGIEKVIALCEKREVEHLVVYRMDRLTERTLDLLILIERILIPNKVQLHSIIEKVDTSTPQGKFYLAIIGAAPRIGLALGLMFCITLWFFSSVGRGIVDLFTKPKNGKKNQGTAPGLCADCWLSGDCEREKKATKSEQTITSCRGYLPKSDKSKDKGY